MGTRQIVTALTTVATLAGAVLGFGTVVPQGAAATDRGGPTTDEVRLLALTNQARTSVGVPVLSFDAALSSVARWWAQAMARDRAISHNPDLGSEIAGWSRLAENVGVGSSIDQVHDALLASPSHYANLSDAGFPLVGIGVASGGGRVYVVEDFGKAAGGSRASVTDPGPPPTTAPATTTTVVAPVGPRVGIAPPPAVPDPEGPADVSILTFVLDALRALDPSSRR